MAKARSSRSFCVSAGIGTTASGTLMPLRSEISPPTSATQVIVSMPACFTRRRILPSLISSRWPCSITSNSSGCGRHTRESSPGASLRSRVKVEPWAMRALPPAKVPTRSFGPCRSQRIAIGRSNSFSSARTVRKASAWTAWSPWLMLKRKASAPARNNSRSTSISRLAGPMVARILTLRSRGENS